MPRPKNIKVSNYHKDYALHRVNDAERSSNQYAPVRSLTLSEYLWNRALEAPAKADPVVCESICFD